MCCRFLLTTDADEIAEHFEAEADGAFRVSPERRARYNIAPTQNIAVVRMAAKLPKRELTLIKWGLAPPQANAARPRSPMFNARAESVAEKPAFRQAFRARRCLIPADGFYEWRSTGGERQPFLFRNRDGSLLAFAGVWEAGSDGSPETCAILTTRPNALMEPIHDRMPLTLRPQDYATWLSAAQDAIHLRSLMEPYAAELLEVFPVSRVVNNSKNDVPECAQPVSA